MGVILLIVGIVVMGCIIRRIAMDAEEAERQFNRGNWDGDISEP